MLKAANACRIRLQPVAKTPAHPFRQPTDLIVLYTNFSHQGFSGTVLAMFNANGRFARHQPKINSNMPVCMARGENHATNN